MFGSRKVIKQTTTPYATQADFRRVFQEDMNRLYLLSFLLTGERNLAEQCFVSGLKMSSEGNPVFKEWATSWARMTIILTAIRMARPRLGDPQRSSVPPNSAGPSAISRAKIANIIALPPFERFVFVMSVLECYTEQACFPSSRLHTARGNGGAGESAAPDWRRCGATPQSDQYSVG